MNNLLSKVQRGFMPLAILLLAATFLVAGILTFTPRGDVFADLGSSDHINVLPNGDIEVYPLPSQAAKPPNDVQNVQWAVDNVAPGGTVFLMANDKNGSLNDFNFGADGSVKITKDVIIVGETDLGDLGPELPDSTEEVPSYVFPEGKPLTKIQGGFYSFSSPWYEGAIPGGGPNITIKGIHFSGAKHTPIELDYCSGATVSGNFIENAIPVEYLTVEDSEDPNLEIQIYDTGGISVGNYEPDDDWIYPLGSVVGNLNITNNMMDMQVDPAELAEYTSAGGIECLGMNDVTFNVKDNIVLNNSRNAIMVMDVLNTEGAPDSIITIENNKVDTGTLGSIYWPNSSAPQGIVLGIWDSTDRDQSRTQYFTKNNNVVINGTNGTETTAGAITLLANNSEIIDNDITVYRTIDGAPAGRGIKVYGTDNDINENKIKGAGQRGIFIFPFYPITGDPPAPPALGADLNRIIGNDLSLFTPTNNYIFGFQARYNIVAGPVGGLSPTKPKKPIMVAGGAENLWFPRVDEDDPGEGDAYNTWYPVYYEAYRACYFAGHFWSQVTNICYETAVERAEVECDAAGLYWGNTTEMCYDTKKEMQCAEKGGTWDPIQEKCL
jgi:hypothetical protein